MRWRSKYGVRTDALGKAARTADGILFASQRECIRYLELKLLEKAGTIRNLRLQPRYPLCAFAPLPDRHGIEICDYIADFQYQERLAPGAPEIAADPRCDGWMTVIEDCKGVRTDIYKLKKKLFKANYGREIRET